MLSRSAFRRRAGSRSRNRQIRSPLVESRRGRSSPRNALNTVTAAVTTSESMNSQTSCGSGTIQGSARCSDNRATAQNSNAFTRIDREPDRAQDEPAEQREQHRPKEGVGDCEQDRRGKQIFRDGQQRNGTRDPSGRVVGSCTRDSTTSAAIRARMLTITWTRNARATPRGCVASSTRAPNSQATPRATLAIAMTVAYHRRPARRTSIPLRPSSRRPGSGRSRPRARWPSRFHGVGS